MFISDHVTEDKADTLIDADIRKVNMKRKMAGHKEMFGCFDHKVMLPD